MLITIQSLKERRESWMAIYRHRIWGEDCELQLRPPILLMEGAVNSEGKERKPWTTDSRGRLINFNFIAEMPCVLPDRSLSRRKMAR